jgi:hypothetical protein
MGLVDRPVQVDPDRGRVLTRRHATVDRLRIEGDAVDSLDAGRIANIYLPAPSTTLQFNADPPIITVEAIKAFSARFAQIVTGIRHTIIEIWTNPLKGGVVPWTCRRRDPTPLSPWYLLPSRPFPFATHWG